jgi:elongation factor G
LEPGERGTGLVFETAVSGADVPKGYHAAVERGVREAMDSGPVAGYPLVDFKARLVGGSYHEVDSSTLAFQIAGAIALREGVEKAAPILLEPVMSVEVVIPEDYVGEVLGDLSARNAQVSGMEMTIGGQTVDAIVPLAEMFGYATALRSITQGRGTFTMEFDHYRAVPSDVAERIVLGYQR